MEFEEITHDDWKNFFSGRWSVLSASYWGVLYARRPFSKLVDRFVSDTVLIYEKTTGLSGYFRSSQIDSFTTNLVGSLQADPEAVAYICDNLKTRTDDFLTFVDKHIGKDISLATYSKFQDLLMEYYVFHIQNKYAPENMSEEMLEKYLPLFESARIHAEPVFMRSEELMRELANIHAAKIDYEPDIILSMVGSEFHEYLRSGVVPDKEMLISRSKRTALVTQNHGTEAVFGDEFEEIQDILSMGRGAAVMGTTAYPGKVEGVARIIFDPTQAAHFKEGEILVTKMTRPDYLPLMKKAAAFVTDGGGILCHAAIVARELKKPCVIGTQTATEQIKDGEKISLDADNGVVTIVQ